jgi:hypothetical protein
MEDPNYIKTAIKNIIVSDGDGDTTTRQDEDKRYRQQSLGVYKSVVDVESDVYKFYRWITTDHETGERYYLVFDDNKRCIRCQKWTDIQKSGLYPWYYWAAYPEPDEFWSRGPLEVSRMTLNAQEKSINQLLDNADMINDPQKVYNADVIRNVSELKWKRRSLIAVSGVDNVNNAVATLDVPTLQTPTETYSILDGIQQSVSGVTADVAGVSEAEKVGVYEGNVQQANDRFALMQDSYEQGYYRLALLFREAIKQHFTKKTAIKIMGSRGYTFMSVTPEMIKMHDNDFDVLISSKSQEQGVDMEKDKAKIEFLNKYLELGILNPKRVFEEGAKIVGFEDDEIKSLLDTQNYINNEARAYAESNMQRILKGKAPEIYYDADESYVREFKSLFGPMSEILNKKPEFANAISKHIVDTMEMIADNQDQTMEESVPEPMMGDVVGQATMQQQQDMAQEAQNGALQQQQQVEAQNVAQQGQSAHQQAILASQLKMQEAQNQAQLDQQLQQAQPLPQG